MRVKLSETGKILTGKTPKTSDVENYRSNDIPFVKPSDLDENNVCRISDTEFWISKYAKEKARILPPKSVLVTCIGIIGKVGINNTECAFNQQINAIIPNTEKYLSDYIAYAVLAKQKHLQDIANAPVVPIINKSQFSDIEIQSADKQTQIKMVDRLNKVSLLINKCNEQKHRLDELIESRFVEMFGEPIENPFRWNVKTLKQLSVLITNGNTPKGGSVNYVDSGIIFLRSQNVWRNKIDLSDVAYIDEQTHREMKRSIVKHKDILITKTGRINTENSSLGRAALWLGKDDSANLNGHVYLVRLKDTVVPEFIVTILTGEAYRKYIRKVCVGGIDKRQINLEQVEEFPIILPPKELQIKFTEFTAKVEQQKATVQKSIDRLETLKKSLMQEYFG